MPHSPLSRRPLPFPAQRIEDRHRFSTLAVCHVLIHPIALRRAVLHLELPEAGETDLFALLRGLDDAGEHRIDGLLGRALLDARLARHVIDQVGYFYSGLLE